MRHLVTDLEIILGFMLVLSALMVIDLTVRYAYNKWGWFKNIESRIKNMRYYRKNQP